MRLTPPHAPRTTQHATRNTRRQSGSAVIVIMALLAILLLYMAYNLKTLANLGRELRLLERQQTHRLQTVAPKTNSPPAVIISTNSSSPPRTN
jgi:hypothetical protein